MFLGKLALPSLKNRDRLQSKYKDRHFVKSAQTELTDTESISYQPLALLETDKHHVVIFVSQIS